MRCKIFMEGGSEIFGSEYKRYRAEKSLLSATGIRDIYYLTEYGILIPRPPPPPPTCAQKVEPALHCILHFSQGMMAFQDNDKKASGMGWG